MECEKKEEALQQEIDRYRSEKTKLETEKKMKQDRMVCRQEVSLLLYLITLSQLIRYADGNSIAICHVLCTVSSCCILE